MDENREVLTTAEAMLYIRVAKSTVLKLIREGRIHATKAGRDWRFLKSELDKFLRGENEKAATR